MDATSPVTLARFEHVFPTRLSGQIGTSPTLGSEVPTTKSNFLRGRSLKCCVSSTGSNIDDLRGPSVHLFSITASPPLRVVVGLGALTRPQLQEFKRRRRRRGKRRRKKKFNHVLETEFKKKKNAFDKGSERVL